MFFIYFLQLYLNYLLEKNQSCLLKSFVLYILRRHIISFFLIQLILIFISLLQLIVGTKEQYDL